MYIIFYIILTFSKNNWYSHTYMDVSIYETILGVLLTGTCSITSMSPFNPVSYLHLNFLVFSTVL